MLLNPYVHCFVPCSFNICPLHILGMSRACIHLGMHNYHVSSHTWCDSLDKAY